MRVPTTLFVFLCLCTRLGKTFAQNNVLSECGQTLLADDGVIEYKLNETYNAGELCTFIIKIEWFSGATFTLERHGFNPAGQDAVAVFPLHTGSPQTPSYFGPNSASRLSFPQSTFFVVFRTTTNNGTGFRLSFKHENSASWAIPGPARVFNNDSSMPLELPFPSGLVIAYHPIGLTSGAKLLTGNSTLELTVAENFVAVDDCSDYIDIHTYNGQENLYLGRLCGKDQEPKVFNTQGIFIVVYVSNNAIDTSPPQAILSWKTVN